MSTAQARIIGTTSPDPIPRHASSVGRDGVAGVTLALRPDGAVACGSLVLRNGLLSLLHRGARLLCPDGVVVDVLAVRRTVVDCVALLSVMRGLGRSAFCNALF